MRLKFNPEAQVPTRGQIRALRFKSQPHRLSPAEPPPLCSTGHRPLWVRCPAYYHLWSSTYEAGQRVSLTTYCPWATGSSFHPTPFTHQGTLRPESCPSSPEISPLTPQSSPPGLKTALQPSNLPSKPQICSQDLRFAVQTSNLSPTPKSAINNPDQSSAAWNMPPLDVWEYNPMSCCL